MEIELYKRQVKENIVSALLDYLSEDEECEYTEKDVQKSESILVEYLDNLSRLEHTSDSAIMKQVKRVVTSLNKLNEKTDFSLIETDAREDIWKIIQNSAVECELSLETEDVTEEWREW